MIFEYDCHKYEIQNLIDYGHRTNWKCPNLTKLNWVAMLPNSSKFGMETCVNAYVSVVFIFFTLSTNKVRCLIVSDSRDLRCEAHVHRKRKYLNVLSIDCLIFVIFRIDFTRKRAPRQKVKEIARLRSKISSFHFSSEREF